MNQTWENKKTQILELILAYLVQIYAQKTFLEVLSLLAVRHCFNLSSNAT